MSTSTLESDSTRDNLEDYDGDIHGLTEIKGFVKPSEEGIEFC